MRLALGLEFEGTAFTGWQSQADGRGVQDALERALEAVAQEPIGTVAAGRTDAGVHATMQIVHFGTSASRPDEAWVRGVNSHLPAAVAVQWSKPVPPEFHARFAATARHYTYILANQHVRPALLAGRVGWYHRTLDVERMREAAALLVGTHDFSTFRATECQAQSPVKTMTCAAISRMGDYIRFDFSANAFLHHMVRNIVGALVRIGAGKAPSDWIAQLLDGRDRTVAAATFPADGLYLTGADYGREWELPSTRRAVVLPFE